MNPHNHEWKAGYFYKVYDPDATLRYVISWFCVVKGCEVMEETVSEPA